VKIVAYCLAGLCLIFAMAYLVLPGGDLPSFLPGYEPGSTHIHHLHAFAALVAAIVFLLFAFSSRR
jgi:hypothetical protein